VNLTTPGLVLAILGSDIAAAAAPAPCLSDMRDSLVRGHFAGPLICSPRDASFRRAGRTAVTGFSIYDYRYRFLAVRGGVMHGGQRLIVFRGRDYIGQYSLSPPPFLTVAVKGTHVLLQIPGTHETVRLDFSRKPPGRIFAHGQIAAFAR